MLLGKLLGETYRLQHAMGLPCSRDDQEIHALLHGFETALDRELPTTGGVSEELERKVLRLLEQDPLPGSFPDLRDQVYVGKGTDGEKQLQAILRNASLLPRLKECVKAIDPAYVSVPETERIPEPAPAP